MVGGSELMRLGSPPCVVPVDDLAPKAAVPSADEGHTRVLLFMNTCPLSTAGGNPELVLNQLVKHTAVSTRFSANMVALVGAQPRTLNLKDFLQHFLDFRYGCWTAGMRIMRLCIGALGGHCLQPCSVPACTPSGHLALASSTSPHTALHPAACHALSPGVKLWSGGRSMSWAARSSACTWWTASWPP